MNKMINSTSLSQSIFVEMLDLTPDALLLIDLNTKLIVYANKACVKYYGYEQEEFLGMGMENLTASDKNKTASEFQETIKKYPDVYHYYTMHVRKNGCLFPVEVITRMVVINERRYFLSHITNVIRNSGLKDKFNSLISQINSQADRDSLTGAYNRAYLYNVYLPQMMSCSIGLIIFDIDYFKTINDQYGHKGGDMILQTLVKIILSCTRSQDTTVRYGDDEFVVILPNVTGTDIKCVARRVQTAVASTVVLLNQEKVSYSVSAGMALGHLVEAYDLDHIIKKADNELSKVKSMRKQA